MSVATGEEIHRYEWTEILLGQEIIDIIHRMAQEQGMLEVNGNFTYESMPGEEMEYDKDGDVNKDIGVFEEIEYDDHINDDSSNNNK